MTHYEILGIPRDAGYTEIKQRYRRLVKTYHPDLNPSEEAKELIVKITEAYEVLSDPNKRHAYDWLLLGRAVPRREPVVDERVVRRREYIRRRRQQEQERWDQLFRLKVRFYKYQRYFGYLFVFISMLYSWDYSFKPPQGPYELGTVKINQFGDAGGRVGYRLFTTDPDFFYEVKKHQAQQAYIHFSSIFDLPVGISLDGKTYYQFHDTLHSFNNFFSYLLLTLALVLLFNKQYSDWALTLGILPFFVMLFLVLLTYEAML